MSKIQINEFDPQSIPESCTFIVIGAPGSGKTNFIEYLCYYNKHRHPVARVWSDTEMEQGSYRKFIRPLYISEYYDKNELDQSIIRQKTCKAEDCRNSYSINILDDIAADKSVLKTKSVIGLFKYGSQWWDSLTIFGTHYALEFPPDIRKTVSYVVLFREPDINERKKLYENFAGIVGTFKVFCDLMDQITGDYTCIVIKKRSQSNELKDCVFYCKAEDMTKVKWSFGCEQYKKWSDDRYNKSYIPKAAV